MFVVFPPRSFADDGRKGSDYLEEARPENDDEQRREHEEHQREYELDGSLRRGLFRPLPASGAKGV
jgi:hypothetical protein